MDSLRPYTCNQDFFTYRRDRRQAVCTECGKVYHLRKGEAYVQCMGDITDEAGYTVHCPNMYVGLEKILLGKPEYIKGREEISHRRWERLSLADSE